MLSYSTIEYGLVPEISIFLGAFAFRAGIEILGLFFEVKSCKYIESEPEEEGQLDL